MTEKLTKLKEQMAKLVVHEEQMLASSDQQISLTDPADGQACCPRGADACLV
ncbi:hypothetical protein ACVMHY_006067 [Bradyrhizobium barranii subsp. barranii]